MSLQDPHTLKFVIDVSSDISLEQMLISKDTDKNAPAYSLKQFGLTDTLQYWKNIQERYEELVERNVENKIGILRTELDSILNRQEIPEPRLSNTSTRRQDITQDIDER